MKVLITITTKDTTLRLTNRWSLNNTHPRCNRILAKRFRLWMGSCVQPSWGTWEPCMESGLAARVARFRTNCEATLLFGVWDLLIVVWLSNELDYIFRLINWMMSDNLLMDLELLVGVFNDLISNSFLHSCYTSSNFLLDNKLTCYLPLSSSLITKHAD